MLVSTNGIDWTTSLLVPPQVGLTSIAQDGQIALAVGSGGFIYRLGEVQRPTVVLLNNAGVLRYRVSGQSGVNFSLEQSPDLLSWISAAFILNAGQSVNFQQLLIPGSAKQFYRVTIK